jgi:hypothetical protein
MQLVGPGTVPLEPVAVSTGEEVTEVELARSPVADGPAGLQQLEPDPPPVPGAPDSHRDTHSASHHSEAGKILTQPRQSC